MERERERERGGYPRLHWGQPRRYSPSPEVRYYRVGRGPRRVPLNGGDRGEWSNVRPRKGKVQEQDDRQRDRLREDQRHGGSRERRQGQSRVRSGHGSANRYYLEDEIDYGYQELGHGRRVIVHYERPVRVRDCDALTYEETHVLEPRQLPPNLCEKGSAAHSAEGRVQQLQK